MAPNLAGTLFNQQAKSDLNDVCEVLSWEPVQGAPKNDTEILLASWGGPNLDKEFLDALPNLKMVAYAAGTIKKIVTDDFW